MVLRLDYEELMLDLEKNVVDLPEHLRLAFFEFDADAVASEGEIMAVFVCEIVVLLVGVAADQLAADQVEQLDFEQLDLELVVLDLLV